MRGVFELAQGSLMRDPLEYAAGKFPRWKKVFFWKLRFRTARGRGGETKLSSYAGDARTKIKMEISHLFVPYC